MKALAILWQRHRLLLGAFLVTTLITLFFATRFLLSILYWSDPAHRNQPLEGWMTIGYVAHSYDVPRDRLMEILNLQPSDNQNKRARPTLERIARDQGQSLDAFEIDVKAAIALLRAQEPSR
ncbi:MULTISPECIES: hypothetical protein [Alphaproteobacteria]|uniref:Uncharacterized protein n=2 Tax=Alphaproteobacteria TaxID=28211 RepID=A0A512HJN1_9HYPH|nr:MULTISPECIES: hypothetical protein [Alphaproteobacteria]GEO85649.1 hypothetical protein RNA01_25810 [Ciceribacter naphthalenivorans]GLR21996.1 hypothetical protein GCM10007920_17830 [Ciceribacter naphthalenivorans]GLT04852.1 hypothetical protein GCM10007926_17830 [Sphingomonas psychrolutea]